MANFRKKPVIIDAVQFNPDGKHWYDIEFPEGVRSTTYMEVSELAGGTSGCSRSPEMWTWSVCGVVDTLEGRLLVIPGDWIITGVAGERYPCKPDIFAATYESVDLPLAEDLAVEIIARTLCSYHRENPDEMVEAGDQLGNPRDYPRWMLGMPEARAIANALHAAAQPALVPAQPTDRHRSFEQGV